MSTGYRPAQTANIYLGGRPQVRNWHNSWMFPTNNRRTCPTTSYKQIGNLSRIVPVPMYFLLEMSCLQLHFLFVIATPGNFTFIAVLVQLYEFSHSGG